jgi:hypothetical protein
MDNRTMAGHTGEVQIVSVGGDIQQYEWILHVCGHTVKRRLFGSDRIIEQQRLYYQGKPCAACEQREERSGLYTD